jgi:hypothetical protein
MVLVVMVMMMWRRRRPSCQTSDNPLKKTCCSPMSPASDDAPSWESLGRLLTGESSSASSIWEPEAHTGRGWWHVMSADTEPDASHRTTDLSKRQ